MTTEIKNIGLHFYRNYYKYYFGPQGHLKTLKEDKEKQLNFTKKNNEQFATCKDLSAQKYFYKAQYNIELKTVYPGLSTGGGYAFGAGMRGEFQLGFLFDHTTGLPYIPGSSVKGTLRSRFLSGYSNSIKQKESIDYITEFLQNNNKEEYCTFRLKENYDKAEVVRKIEMEIFEGIDFTKDNQNEEHLSTYQRDIFHDAYIIKEVEKGQTKGCFLGIDYITPHKDRLKNPIPLPFLKILPGVTIQFNFDLKDGYYLKAKGKKELFERILKDFGIGAKTNVGYGQFEEVK